MPSLPNHPTVHQALRWAKQILSEANVPSPTTDAEWLLAHLMGYTRSELHLQAHQPLTRAQVNELMDTVGERQQRRPLQQILGETEFFSLPFKITPDVLIPRPETEVLVEAVIDRLKDHFAPHILDLCTGSGAIAVALAHNLPNSRLTASDVSAKALLLAQRNIHLNHVADQVQLVRADLFTPFAARPHFHAIVSNPPYIPSNDLSNLQPEVRDHEPHLALVGGPDGLDLYRRIIPQSVSYLHPGGLLALEIGEASGVQTLLSSATALTQLSSLRDLDDKERVLLAQKKPNYL
ncbi:MAG: peptide chain release factor N(5)-glutamine methyltransferase [bacterium]|nr:peptide chain release factor N(5)-glutamine methyltransferase [bacterium]